MACKNICRLCDRLVISDSVTFTGGNLLIDIPAGTYTNECKYCIVVAQTIPSTTTINAPVYITIGGSTTNLYPLTKRSCAQVTACSIRTRTKYSTVVSTNATGGSFRITGCNELPCAPDDALASLPVATAAATGGDTA